MRKPRRVHYRAKGRILQAFLLLSLITTATLGAQGYHRKLSPFDNARFLGDDRSKLEVLIDGTWYEPLAIDETSIEDIFSFCEARWPEEDKRRRFLQDLVEALMLMDREPGPTVDLRVRTLGDPDAAREIELADVPLTRRKRQRFVHDPDWNAFFHGSTDRQTRPRRRSTRTHVEEGEALGDLELFRVGLKRRFAYLQWKGIDLDLEIEGIEQEIKGASTDLGVPIAWLHRRLQRLLLRFGDGHARIESPALWPRRTGFAPYLLVATGGGVAALRPDRSALVDTEHPYVVEIDGEPLAAWLERVRSDVADGSPQLVLERSLGQLAYLPQVRQIHGLQERAEVTLGLGTTPSRVEQRRTLELLEGPPRLGVWPQRSTQLLDGNIGYLRIERMTPDTEPLHQAMAQFRETHGLVVDVRGNGGGTRHSLLAFAGYLQGPDETSWVGNVATYKRAADRDEDHLASRFVHRRDDPTFDDAQRAVIDAFQKDFEPEWKPEDPVGEQFSEWHYLVLGRTGDPREYFYDRPVVVLSDAGAFSATDIFLGALRGRPRVTLLCRDSSGGSARSESFFLPNTRLRVKAASMASFQPNGQLYDGNGVQVDVEVAQPPTDFLLGGTDRCLEEALRRFE